MLETSLGYFTVGENYSDYILADLETKNKSHVINILSRTNDFREHMVSNLAEVNIYYPSLGYEWTTEEPKMTLAGIVGTCGGDVGLFLGVSFISILKLIDIVFKYIAASIGVNRQNGILTVNSIGLDKV